MSYDVEVVLHSITFKASHELYSKATLTVQSLDGDAQTFTHIVRHPNVSFYQQSVRMKNCQRFRVELVLNEGNRGTHQQIQSFTVDVLPMIEKKEFRRKVSEHIRPLRCTVDFQVYIKEPNLLEDSSSIDAGKFNLQISSRLEKSNEQLHPPFKKQSSVVKGVRPASPFNSKAKEIVKELQEHVINDVFTEQQVKPALSVPGSQPIKTPKQQREIRKPTATKWKSIPEVESELEHILFLRFLSQNNNKITSRLSTKSAKLKEELKQLTSRKEEAQALHKLRLEKPGVLDTKLTAVIFLMVGLLLSIILHL